jgi:exosome complex component RRP40
VLSLADVAAGGAAGGAGGTPAVRLGPSLLQSGGEVRAIRTGTLRQTGGGKLWLETSHKRYLPAAEDAVVGIVVERHAEVRRPPPRLSRVSLVAGVLSSPPALRRAELCGRHRGAVQGCAACAGLRERHATQQACASTRLLCCSCRLTRRCHVSRRPNLDVGSLVYARVESAPRDADPQLSCVDASGKASGMGPLLGGLPFNVPTGGARTLLARPPCAALAALGAAVAFELVVGANGRCWVSAADVATTVLVVNALRQAVDRTPEQGVELVAAMLAAHAAARE